MAFTFTDYAGIQPQPSAMQNMIGKLLSGYSQSTHAKYLPQSIQADIFAKKIGPLATLATTPMFLNNPQFQQSLGNLISQNLGNAGQGFGNISPSNTSTYAGQAQSDIGQAQKIAEQLSHAGKARTGLSSAAAGIENYLGDVGKHITNLFSGTPGELGSSELAKRKNEFDTLLATLKTNAIQTQRLSAADAEKIFAERKDETPASRLARIRKTVPSLFELPSMDESQGTTDTETQTADDNAALRESADISQQIKDNLGIDVPETLIFNYRQNHPGEIDMHKLLKAVGAI